MAHHIMLPAIAKHAALVASAESARRYTMQGVQVMTRKKRVEVNATDGVCLLCMHWLDAEAPKVDVILDRSGLDAVKIHRKQRNIELRLESAAAAMIQSGDTAQRVALLDGRFPDTQSIFDNLPGPIACINISPAAMLKILTAYVKAGVERVSLGIYPNTMIGLSGSPKDEGRLFMDGVLMGLETPRPDKK